MATLDVVRKNVANLDPQVIYRALIPILPGSVLFLGGEAHAGLGMSIRNGDNYAITWVSPSKEIEPQRGDKLEVSGDLFRVDDVSGGLGNVWELIGSKAPCFDPKEDLSIRSRRLGPYILVTRTEPGSAMLHARLLNMGVWTELEPQPRTIRVKKAIRADMEVWRVLSDGTRNESQRISV